jgi:hypothetical protein
MSEISEAYDRLLKSNVRFRFVVDMASMREPPDNRPEAETYRVHLMMAKAFLEHAIDDRGQGLEAALIHICNPNSKLLAGFRSPKTPAASKTVMPCRNAHNATAASGAFFSP